MIRTDDPARRLSCAEHGDRPDAHSAHDCAVCAAARANARPFTTDAEGRPDPDFTYDEARRAGQEDLF